MVRSRRSLSKEDAVSLHTDSGISLSSPPTDRCSSPVLVTATAIKRRKSSLVSLRDICADEDEDGAGEQDLKDADYIQPPPKKAIRGKPETVKRKHHVCSLCSKEFGGKTDLQRHMLIHSDERPHKCSVCGKSYRQAVNLKNHITTAHEHRKQFPCPQCPKSFALKERLRLHMRLHSGEKPYPCALCDKKFARGGQVSSNPIKAHPNLNIFWFHYSFSNTWFRTTRPVFSNSIAPSARPASRRTPIFGCIWKDMSRAWSIDAKCAIASLRTS